MSSNIESNFSVAPASLRTAEQDKKNMVPLGFDISHLISNIRKLQKIDVRFHKIDSMSSNIESNFSCNFLSM